MSLATITIAKSEQTDITTKKTYTYNINFQCLADSIDEADVCFMENAQLFYIPDEKKKLKPGYICPLVSVEIGSAPKDGYKTLTGTEARAVRP